MSNVIKAIVCPLAVLAFFAFDSEQLRGQSSVERKARAHQAEVKARIEENRRKMELRRNPPGTVRVGNTSPKVGNTTPQTGNTVPRNGNASPGTTTLSSSGGNVSTNIDAKTEYVFSENTTVGYLIQIDHTHAFGRSQYQGVIAFSTTKPTPLREDGSGYDFATVDTAGVLIAFEATNQGELKRYSEQDIRLPKTLNFRPFCVSDHKMPEGGNNKLPGNMHRALGVVEAIFPKVPLFEGKKVRDITQDFWLQTEYGDTGRGSLQQISGHGKHMESASGNRAEVVESLSAEDKQGNQLFAYEFHQVATFDSHSRQMSSSRTTFNNNEGGKTDQVVITARQIDYQQARKIAESLK